jgi:hypothetical protein
VAPTLILDNEMTIREPLQTWAVRLRAILLGALGEFPEAGAV